MDRTKVGMLVPLEIVVRYSPESQAAGARTSDSTNEELFKLTFLERLETTKLVQEKIEEVFGKSGQGSLVRASPPRLLHHRFRRAVAILHRSPNASATKNSLNRIASRLQTAATCELTRITASCGESVCEWLPFKEWITANSFMS